MNTIIFMVTTQGGEPLLAERNTQKRKKWEISFIEVFGRPKVYGIERKQVQYAYSMGPLIRPYHPT